jgi:serine protease inhibitor
LWPRKIHDQEHAMCMSAALWITGAAAATAVLIAAGSAMTIITDFTPTFRADHGFVLLIHDNSTDTVLFMGRLANPLK